MGERSNCRRIRSKIGWSELESLNRWEGHGRKHENRPGKKNWCNEANGERGKHLEEDWKANQIFRISSTHPNSQRHPVKLAKECIFAFTDSVWLLLSCFRTSCFGSCTPSSHQIIPCSEVGLTNNPCDKVFLWQLEFHNLYVGSKKVFLRNVFLWVRVHNQSWWASRHVSAALTGKYKLIWER